MTMNTEQQIEALAKAYADSFGLPKSSYDLWVDYCDKAEKVLRWLLKDHEILPRLYP